MSPSDPLTDRQMAIIDRLVQDARGCGFDDPVFGGLVIAARVIARAEQEAPRGRHPDGTGSRDGVLPSSPGPAAANRP